MTKTVDAINKRIQALEAKISTTITGTIIADESNHRATLHLGDPKHPMYHVPCISSYYPVKGQAVRVQRSGDKLLVLGAVDFLPQITVSDSPPPKPFPGQFWYAVSIETLYSWSGTSWTVIGGSDATARAAATAAKTAADLAKTIADQASTSANGKNHNYYGTVMPTMPPGVFVDGDMWFDQSLTTDGYVKNTPYIWRVVSGVGSWVTTRDDLLRTNLNTALGAANGKNRNFYQIAAPTVAGVAPYILQVGDTWFDSDGGYAISRWDGTTWVAAPLGTTAIADGAITTQQITASGIDAGRITSGIIDAAVITVKNIDASKITVGGMDASRITVGTLGSQVIYSGAVYANKIVAASGGIGGSVALEVSTVTASGPAFRVNYGYSYFANDVQINGILYGGSTSTGPSIRSGASFYSLSDSPSNVALRIQSGQLQHNNIAVLNAGYVTLGIGTSTGGVPSCIGKTSSSRTIKKDIEDITHSDIDPTKLLDLPVRQFRYKEGDNTLIPGFIAEEVAEVYPVAAFVNEDGKPENWMERHIIPGLLALIQQQDKQLKAQGKRIKALEER
jgi:hypothetical protein